MSRISETKIIRIILKYYANCVTGQMITVKDQMAFIFIDMTYPLFDEILQHIDGLGMLTIH